MGADDEKAKKKARNERYARIMWAYVCGGIAVVSLVTGFRATFIPAGFAVLGAILAAQLIRAGEQRHGIYAGAMSFGGLMIWLSYTWPTIHAYLGG
jgi:hypothetical protein